MEQERTPSPLPDLDQAQFERVWRRVMPENRADCPFTLLTQDSPTPAVGGRLMPNGSDPPSPDFLSAPAREPAPMESIMAMAPVIPITPVGAPPSVQDVPAFAVAALDEGPVVNGVQMQNMISAELSSQRTYRAMARQIRGKASQTLSTLAADEGRHAKRLATAYFLMVGMRFWPENLPGERVDTLWGGIRRCYLKAQESEVAYRKLAQEAGDNSLQELFSDLAQEEAGHALFLRKLLEEL